MTSAYLCLEALEHDDIMAAIKQPPDERPAESPSNQS